MNNTYSLAIEALLRTIKSFNDNKDNSILSNNSNNTLSLGNKQLTLDHNHKVL